MPKGLTDRQRAFVDAYARTRRGTEAAIAAGYGAKWAASAASRLLAQPEIAAAVKRRIDPSTAPAAPLPPSTPLEYLLSVVKDSEARLSSRIQAAKAALPYCHAKPAALGKKGQQQATASATNGGRFVQAKPPAKVTPIRPDQR